MSKASNVWGVEIVGTIEDKNVWRELLKPPFDPFVEKVKDDRVDYIAIRSTAFDKVFEIKAVYEFAKNIFKSLNLMVSKIADYDPVIYGPAIDFSPNGQP